MIRECMKDFNFFINKNLLISHLICYIINKMEFDDNDYIDNIDNISNKLIIKQIENILEEMESYYSVDMILKELFNKFNINKDVIKDIINSDNIKKEKCKLCTYYSEYTYNKHILRCNLCNNINFVKNVI